MAQDLPAATTPTYCQPADVGYVLQKAVPPANASEGDPALAYWQDAIMSAEEEVDRACKQAWRERVVTNEYPFDGLGNMPDPEGFVLVPLRRMAIKDFVSASGDKIEVWNGSQYENWVTARTQGRNADWYLVPELGHLYLRTRVLYGNPAERVRLTYRYGHASVPRNIKRATALLAAAELGAGQVESQHGQGSGLTMTPAERRVDLWRDQAFRLLTPFIAVEGL